MFYFGTGTGLRFGTYIFNIKDFFSNKISQKVKINNLPYLPVYFCYK